MPLREDKGMSLARSLIVGRGESLGWVVEAERLVDGVQGVTSVTLAA
jgi:hypothetical protein